MVKFIKYKGEDLPIRVSYYALKMLKAECNKPISQLKEDDYDAYEALLYYALKQGFKKVEKEFTIKREEMEDVMDECFFEFIKIIPSFFTVLTGEPKPETPVAAKQVAGKK
jgi:hypothetical protein